MNICQVSLKGNIPIIKENLKNFNKLYKDNYFYIVCPKKDIKLFNKKIKNSKVFFIEEEGLIKFSKFKKISNSYLNKTIYYDEIQERLTWYYQQILKIAFLINFVEQKKENMIIWDADTILIDKILFFKKKYSNYCGTTSYFHKAYYRTNNYILGKLPKYFISSLTQFTSITPNEVNFLVNRLSKKKKRIKNTSEWLTHIIMKSISTVHSQYNGSMFSEYELIGESNLLYNFKKQELVSGLRDHLNGKLTNLQISILKYLGFKYIAYEHTHENKNSRKMLIKQQSWIVFLKLLIKKLSNNFFRGLKHHLNYAISLFKPTVG
jgi:hypothetical protein